MCIRDSAGVGVAISALPGLGHALGHVVDVPEGKDDGGALEVQLVDPPVLARAKGAAELGAEVTVRLTGVSLDEGRVDFEVA